MLKFEGNSGRYYRAALRLVNLRDASGVFIARGSRIANGSLIGAGTRINGPIVIKGGGKCEIGKYCAIGDNVRIITSNHKVDVPVLQLSLIKKIGLQPECETKQHISIGHNVWVGDGVIIVPGVTIGRSAVIGAGAVVSRDVPAYGIAVGCPAKLVRYRLTESRIKELEDLAWWDWTIEEMIRRKDLLK